MNIRLFDAADVIRSKNSGPYELTFDIIFTDDEMFQKVWDSGAINAQAFAKLYDIPETDVLGVIGFAPAKAVKITIKRPLCSGALGETDVYGAQQHAPLIDWVIKL